MKRESDTKRKLLEVPMTLIWGQSYGSVGEVPVRLKNH
jgi:hypothetical protein